MDRTMIVASFLLWLLLTPRQGKRKKATRMIDLCKCLRRKLILKESFQVGMFLQE